MLENVPKAACYLLIERVQSAPVSVNDLYTLASKIVSRTLFSSVALRAFFENSFPPPCFLFSAKKKKLETDERRFKYSI